MIKKILLAGFLAVMANTVVTSCRDDDFQITQTQDSEITFVLEGQNIKTFKEVTIEILEINTGTKKSIVLKDKNTEIVRLPYGAYKISVNGTAINNEGDEVQIGGTFDKNISSGALQFPLSVSIKEFANDLIIEEVFFTGVKSPQGRPYNSGKYFKIVNNTDKVLYADGLLIAQSNFLTVDDDKPTPYNKEKYFYVKGVLMLPGSGKEYPVQPGDFIVIADNAVDHSQKVSTAYNLSNADFEFPVIGNPALGQVDNPSVPNAETIYVNYNFVFLHNRGFESYAIARLPQGYTKQQFLAEHKYDYKYTINNREVSRSAMKIPNEWIIDAENNSIEAKFVHTLTASHIDAGWTACGRVDRDDTRYGKSVRRKVLGVSSNGKNIYKDSNNSTEDFVKDSTPSLKDGIVH